MAADLWSLLHGLLLFWAETERNTDRKKIGLKEEVPILPKIGEAAGRQGQRGTARKVSRQSGRGP